jgi:MFS family permease
LAETPTTMETIDSISTNTKKRSDWFNFERNEILLLVSYFLFGIAFANYEPYAPVWLSQIFQEESFLIIGFVVVIPSLIGVIGTPLWGFLADKFGVKKFVIIGMFAFSFMFLGLVFVVLFNGSTTLFLVLILIGYLIGSAQTSNLFALATRSVNKPKEVVLAKFTMSVSIAFVIFSPLAGWIYDYFTNSAVIQLSIAVGTVFISTVIIFFVKEGKKETVEKEIVQQTKKKEPLTLVPFVFSFLMIFTFLYQSGAGFWAYSSIYFLKELSVEGVYFSIFIIVKTALAVPLSLLLGRVKSKKRIGIIIASFTSYYVLVYVLMTIFPTNWILLIIFNSVPMYPIYNIFLYGLTASYSQKSKRATAFGIFNAIGTLGYIIGIIILGVIADHWTSGTYAGIFSMFPMTIIATSITFILALIFYLIRLRREDNEINAENSKQELVESLH